ncbi:hypothetical protein M2266_005903 [Streptomyces sp. SPB162]|nr:hypothetical protein [Streptomyces sp. SPB162]
MNQVLADATPEPVATRAAVQDERPPFDPDAT